VAADDEVRQLRGMPILMGSDKLISQNCRIEARNPLTHPVLYVDFGGLPPISFFVSMSEIFYDGGNQISQRSKSRQR
jgi:hypothetical protein